MSETVTFQITGAMELADDIKKLLSAYPSETETEMEKISNDFKRDVNKKFSPAGNYGKGKRPLAKSWKKTLLKTSAGLSTGFELTNAAPHFHLVENGHNGEIPASSYAMYIRNKSQSSKKETREKKAGKSKKGSYKMQPIGFVPGKHYCERTRNEWREGGRFEARVKAHVEKLMKKYKLT